MPNTPGTYDVAHHRGDTMKFFIEALDAEEEPFDFTDGDDNIVWTAKIQVKTHPSRATPLLTGSTATGEIILGLDGEIGIELPTESGIGTKLWPRMYYDIQLIDPFDNVVTILKGEIDLSLDTTK